MVWSVWARLSWVAALAGLLGLCGCAAAGDGRYVGSASTEQGSCGSGFDASGKATATLLLHGAEAEFAPSDGVVVLQGHVDAAGHVLAQSSVAGADHKPFQQVFEADRKGAQVKGLFASPRCRASVELARR